MIRKEDFDLIITWHRAKSGNLISVLPEPYCIFYQGNLIVIIYWIKPRLWLPNTIKQGQKKWSGAVERWIEHRRVWELHAHLYCLCKRKESRPVSEGPSVQHSPLDLCSRWVIFLTTPRIQVETGCGSALSQFKRPVKVTHYHSISREPFIYA